MKTRRRRQMAIGAIQRVEMTSVERDEAADKVAAFLATKRRSPRTVDKRCRSQGVSDLASAMADAKRRAGTGDWEGATGRTLVGVFLLCHRMVYQFVPADLESTPMFRSACKQAELCYRRHFRDKPGECVEFLKWAWLRERGRQQWAQREGRDVRRLCARFVFSDSFVDDYRVHLQGARHGARRSQQA